mmetsp:Transcript_111354/g.314367  ORF Transcript_111354/g.314367 Transcript_111354/m.314367 type:complete len:85 (-) Transcript_111354:507-761(-)
MRMHIGVRNVTSKIHAHADADGQHNGRYQVEHPAEANKEPDHAAEYPDDIDERVQGHDKVPQHSQEYGKDDHKRHTRCMVCTMA